MSSFHMSEESVDWPWLSSTNLDSRALGVSGIDGLGHRERLVPLLASSWVVSVGLSVRHFVMDPLLGWEEDGGRIYTLEANGLAGAWAGSSERGSED